ncbi:MAG TPA: amidohydrolase family protein [Terracidiphilus sp.]|jgi:cytosine/adenosine deaminase-related metal-dependent hydrolase
MPRTIRLLLFALVLFARQLHAASPVSDRLLIRGNIVTPQGVIANGWLDIEHGRIARIAITRPDLTADVPALETSDFIFPGFIDLHDHPSFNVFPRWTPPHKFPNRYAWREWDVVKTLLETPAAALLKDHSAFCDIDEYVEIKALIGGTTSMIGFSGHGLAKPQPGCIKGLVRNLDVYTGFYGTEQGHERIVNSIGITSRDMTPEDVARVRREIAAGAIDLLAIHIAEGLPTDPESAHELDQLDAAGLLTSHTTLIHSVGLSPSQFARAHRAGASIVWSPRSNLELYGATANVDAAFRQGVTIALAPDWSPTGSDNMLDEIKYASDVNRDRLDGLFSSRQLVEMASSIPARIAHIDDKVGTLAPGMLADFFLVRHDASNPANPYEVLVDGSVDNIDLVVIGGVPVYGEPGFFKELGIKSELLSICNQSRALNSAALTAGSFAQVQARLEAKMHTVGSSLAPLAECVH